MPELAFSPKRAMAELRHSSSIGSRATAGSSASPMKRDEALASSPLCPDNAPVTDDDDDNRNRHFRDRGLRSIFSAHLNSLFPFFHLNDDSRSQPYNSKIWLFVLLLIVVAGVTAISSIISRWVSLFYNLIYWPLTV